MKAAWWIFGAAYPGEHTSSITPAFEVVRDIVLRVSNRASSKVRMSLIVHKILLGCRQYCRGDHRAANRVVSPDLVVMRR